MDFQLQSLLHHNGLHSKLCLDRTTDVLPVFFLVLFYFIFRLFSYVKCQEMDADWETLG